MKELCIITTGGTIDKVYFDDKSDFQVGAPQIGDILEALGVAFKFSVHSLMRKDSLHLTDDDRELICSTAQNSSSQHILITHGTDTMVETARVLRKVQDKVMVLTGALNPARFQSSDAVFNIGTAVGAVQTLGAGVYIAMNGRIWDPQQVRKNIEANRFEWIESLK